MALSTECPSSYLIDISSCECKSCKEPNGKFHTEPFHAGYWNYRIVCECGSSTKYCADPYCARDYFTGVLAYEESQEGIKS